MSGTAEDIAQALTVVDNVWSVDLKSIEAWGYDALYGNIGYRVVDHESGKILLSSDAGRARSIMALLPLTLKTDQTIALDDGLVVYRLPAIIDSYSVYIDVARSDRLGELAKEAVVPAITEAVFASILLAVIVFTAALLLTTRRVSKSIRSIATLLVDSAANQREPDVESVDVPVELAPLADAFRAAVSDMLEAYEAQKRFTENAAHELKTPLTVARISIEKLRGIDESERENLLKRIDVTAEMVQRLLELSRAQQKSAFRTQIVSMPDVLKTVRDMLAPVAEKKGVAITIDSSVIDLCIVGDRTAWIVAIKNLVDNALKHAEDVTTVNMVLSRDQLRIENDGSSIKCEHRAHIFERFFRGGASKISSGGLGLSIVQEIVESSGGSIRHFDRQPSGSSFVISFGDMPRPSPSASQPTAGQ